MLGAMLALPVAAQSPPDAGKLLEETRQPARPPQPPAQAPKVVEPPVRPTITLPDGATVTPRGFRISGALSFPADRLTTLVQPWVGRPLDLNGLNEAAGAITRHYQSAGHLLTYAYVPAQKVADGIVELAVLEGRLENVQTVTAQDTRLRDEVVQAHTDSLPRQPPLLQPEVERKLLLLNDIPGVEARAAFTPGASTGGAEMVVSVAEDEPLQLRGEINNHGSRSTGEVRVGLGLQLRDLFGWGDQIQARAMSSGKGRLVTGSLSSTVPVGGDGYRVGFSLSRLTYELSGAFARLGAVGNANTFGIDASYPFLRSTDSNISLRASYEQKRLRDEILLAGTRNPRRNDIIDLTLSFDHRDRWGVTGGNVVASSGSLKFLNDAQRAQDSLNTGRDYQKLSGQVLRQQNLSGPYGLYLRAIGQASGGNLDSSEKFGLAGPGAVRAYAPGAASVDQGGLLTVELRYAHDYVGGGFIWGLFHDHAEGRINRQPLTGATGNAVRLAGSGLSVQWNGGGYGLSASMAWRSQRAVGSDGSESQPRIYLQMVVVP